MTEMLDQPNDQPTNPERAATEVPKGDLLHPEWSELPSWFGYIGVGIAIVAMLIGIAGMVLGARYLVAWVGS
jgi:protein-S-isoprenylcysteine O-methyltransferase Ste14